MKYFKIFSLIAVVALITSCSAGTKVVSSWKEKGVSLRKYNRVLVLGVMPYEYRIAEEAMEKKLVRSLNKKGVNSVSAFVEYGPKAFINKTDQQVLTMVKNRGFDAVITIGLDNKRNITYTSSPNYQTTGVYLNTFYGVNSKNLHSGSSFLSETNLYNIKTDQLLYTVQSKSLKYSSVRKLGKKFSKRIIKNMGKHNLFMKR